MNPRHPTPAAFLLIFASFLVMAIGVYRPALKGPFISDDLQFLVKNPFVRSPTVGGLVEVLDPNDRAREGVGGNYAPVMHLAHAAQWQLWETDTRGYHLTNLVVHALDATLLVALLCGGGVALPGAVVGGALFLLHPANVDAVAWISQLRTLLALGFALGALLLFRRHPLASVPLFAASLLTKATGAFALPMAAAFYWAWRGRDTARPRQGAALALWTLVLAIYAPLQIGGSAFAVSPVDRYPDLATHIRSMVSIGAHYLAMAATSYGTSAFHEPKPVLSNLDPWWIAGAVFGAAFAWRIVATLRQRKIEAAWWLGAAAAFAPVSQVLPFFFAMADRYLYCILPGLIGGALHAGSELRAALPERLPSRLAGLGGAPIRLAAIAVAALLLVGFGARSHARAALWQDPFRLSRDAALQYPDGAMAHYVAAVRAIERGELDRAFAHLVECARRGGHLMTWIETDPHFEPLHSDPRFARFELAVLADRVESLRRRGRRDVVAEAKLHYLRGELDEAIAIVEEAMQKEGPRSNLASFWERLRELRAQQRSGGAEGAPPPDVFEIPTPAIPGSPLDESIDAWMGPKGPSDPLRGGEPERR